jgi:hypothetical protein
MNLNDFFPYKVCINLDRRPDRWEKVRARFERHDIRQVARFAALDWKALSVPPDWNDVPGAYGCLLSHLEVVREARRRGTPSVLLFEDDVVFDDDLNSKFSRAVEQLPSRWDMIMFGGSHWQEPVRISDNVFRARATAATHAYALNRTVYDSFIELNSRAQSVVDVNNTTLQRERECFCFMPHLAWQDVDYSDVGEREINVWWMKESLVLGSAEMHDVLKRTLVVLAHSGGAANPQATRQLNFIIDHYLRLSPDIAVAVVEQGEGRSVDDRALSRKCRYEFLSETGGRPSLERCFHAGFESFGEGRDYFIFADSNVWISVGDIKANLLKCREHDVVSSFREVFDLTREDTERLLGGGEINVAAYTRREWRGPHADSCFYTRRGFQSVTSVAGESSQVGARGVPSVERSALSMFESPNRAFRLHGGERAGVKGESSR